MGKRKHFVWNMGNMLGVAAVIAGGIALALLLSIPFSRPGPGKVPVSPQFFSWPVMGTVAELDIRGTDEKTAEKARILTGDAFRLVEMNLSVFVTNSIVARLNRGENVRVADDGPFATVVRFALETAKASDGAFDPTVNPLMRVWGFRGGDPAIPSPSALTNALATVGWRRLGLSPTSGGDLLASSGGTELDFGAIAKGYAVDCAYDALAANGFTNFLINLGGNIRVCGSPEPGRSDWNIAVRDPFGRRPPSPLPRPLRSGEAVATSGSYERFVEIKGRRYSHIIDPRTGLPVDNGLASVSVIAPTAMMADAYSTTLFVLGREAGAAFLSAHLDCTAVFIGQ